MTGGLLAFGPCWACGERISFNPINVPSFDGQPICRRCIDLINVERKARGLPEINVPADAYSTAEPGAL